MLILARRRGEEIIVHTDDGFMIRILVTDVRGSLVKIGIAALAHVHVDRKEIWLKKQAEKKPV